MGESTKLKKVKSANKGGNGGLEVKPDAKSVYAQKKVKKPSLARERKGGRKDIPPHANIAIR